MSGRSFMNKLLAVLDISTKNHKASNPINLFPLSIPSLPQPQRRPLILRRLRQQNRAGVKQLWLHRRGVAHVISEKTDGDPVPRGGTVREEGLEGGLIVDKGPHLGRKGERKEGREKGKDQW